jgi:hypothetical protein
MNYETNIHDISDYNINHAEEDKIKKPKQFSVVSNQFFC